MHSFRSLLPFVVEVDFVTVTLIGIFALAPYLPRIVRIETPGGLKIELQREIVKAEETVNAAVKEEAKPERRMSFEKAMASSTFERDKVTSKPIVVSQVVFGEEVAREPEMALVRLRIEMERALRAITVELMGEGGTEYGYLTILDMTHQLVSKQIISSSLLAAIRQIDHLEFLATHGDRVDIAAAAKITDLGVTVIGTLEDILARVRQAKKGKSPEN